MKTDFISNVSHEMKTPIAIIKNYAEMLRAEHLKEEQRIEYAKSVEGAAVRLSYDVCRQLCECILQFEEAWDEKEIELETEIEDVAMIRADRGLLELVWNNLLSNAVKFTEPGGRGAVCQTSDEDGIKISISDTGCGMSRKSMEHIFDKFYQGFFIL